MISLFSSFLSFNSLRNFFLFSFSVPIHWMKFSILSFVANSGLLKCNVRSLASLLILDGWRSFQSVEYIHNQTRFLKVPILHLLFCVCYSYVVNCNSTTANTVTATMTETFVQIIHNFQHFTACQNFFFHCCAPVSLLSQQLNKVQWLKTCRVNTSNYRTMLIAAPNERLHYSLPIYRRKWHMISVLTYRQQQKWSPCSARISDEEYISNNLMQYIIYESF